MIQPIRLSITVFIDLRYDTYITLPVDSFCHTTGQTLIDRMFLQTIDYPFFSYHNS